MFVPPLPAQLPVPPSLRLAELSGAELLAAAADLRDMAATARTLETQNALERLSARYARLAGRRANQITNPQQIVIGGRVLDQNGRPVPDAVIEVCQADASGHYERGENRSDRPRDPHFNGHGRMRTDLDGSYRFTTIRPGCYGTPGGDGLRPSHIHFILSIPGRDRRLFTEMYFPGDPLIVKPMSAPESTGQRISSSLIASVDCRLIGAGQRLGYRFDMVMGQGEQATQFDDVGRHPWLNV